MRLLFILLTVVIASSCTTGYPLKSVDYNDLFTDGNSKMWVINKMYVNDVNIAGHLTWDKDVFIFHESGSLDYISLKAIGHKRPIKGSFYLSSEEKELSIDFPEESWVFDIPVMQEGRIVLKAKKTSDIQCKFELVPLPEL